MDRKYNLKLDLQFRCNNSVMKFRQSDNKTSDFFIRITRAGELINIDDAIVILAVIKPNGLVQSQFLEVKDNKVYADLEKGLKDQLGTYKAQALLIYQDERVSTDVIEYEVLEDSILNQLEVETQENENIILLKDMLSRLSNIELQEQTRIDNENSRVEAENLREKAIEKIKNDINILISETNKKVDNNLNSNTSKIDNLIIDTKEELNKYKENKDKFINENLEEFKENTNKSIDNYKASKDVEINNVLNSYKTNTTNDINSFKNTVNAEINKYKNDKDKEIDKYIEDKNLELDNYVTSKDNEINQYKTSVDEIIDAINKEVENTTGRQVDLENTFNQLVINAGNSNAEIVDARVKKDGTSYSKLGDRLDAVDSQLAHITYDINRFPRLYNEENDYYRFLRALEEMNDGDVLLFDSTMDFGRQALTISKAITLSGKNRGTSIIKDGLINITSSNVICENFFIDAINFADGFKVNDKTCSNIIIRNCKTNVKSHGYLFESYNGLISDVLVENCIAENGIHGFINKASNVTFKNCTCNNISSIAFGCISDNIPGINNVGQCENAIIDNCKANNCGAGFSTYIRNAYSTNIDFECKNININGLFINSCNVALNIGETKPPNGYLAISNIQNINLNNVTITNSPMLFYSIFVYNISNANVNNLINDGYVKFGENISAQDKSKFNQTIYLENPVKSKNITSGNVSIDVSTEKNIEIQISNNTSNIITAKNYVSGDEITFMMRAVVGGTWTYGGFDKMFTVPTSVPMQVSFGECLVTKWIYNRWTSKFICTSCYVSRSH